MFSLVINEVISLTMGWKFVRFASVRTSQTLYTRTRTRIDNRLWWSNLSRLRLSAHGHHQYMLSILCYRVCVVLCTRERINCFDFLCARARLLWLAIRLSNNGGAVWKIGYKLIRTRRRRYWCERALCDGNNIEFEKYVCTRLWNRNSLIILTFNVH